MPGQVLDARRRVRDGDARGEVRADPRRHRDLPAPRLARHLRVHGGEARGGEEAQQEEEKGARAEEPLLERGVVAGEKARGGAEAHGGQGEQARERPHEVPVEVDSHEDVRPDEREDQRDEGEPRAQRKAERRGRPHRGEQDEEEGEGGEEERRLPLGEADRHLRGIQAEQQAAHHVHPVLGGRGEGLDGAVAREEGLLADRRLEPLSGDQSLERQHQQGRAQWRPGEQPLAARQGTAPQAGRAEHEGDGQPLRAREGHERSRRGEADRARAAPPREPPVEEQQREEEEERDVRAVQVTPDDGAGEGDETAGQEALSRSREAGRHPRGQGDGREVERGAQEDGKGHEALAARPRRVGEREERRVEEARGTGRRSLARVVAEGVALGHRLRVLRDDVEVAHLRHEMAARRPQEEAEEARDDGQADEERRAHGVDLSSRLDSREGGPQDAREACPLPTGPCSCGRRPSRRRPSCWGWSWAASPTSASTGCLGTRSPPRGRSPRRSTCGGRSSPSSTRRRTAPAAVSRSVPGTTCRS